MNKARQRLTETATFKLRGGEPQTHQPPQGRDPLTIAWRLKNK
jgi:hypothetical protein